MGNIEGLSGGNVIRAALLCAVLCLPAFPAVPSTPTLLSPVNGQTGVAPTPRFSWHRATGASAYRIQISAHSGFTSLTKDTSGLTDTNYNATQPLHFSKYYWRIRAKNRSGSGAWSIPCSLTVEMVRHVFSAALWYPIGRDTLTYFHKLGYNYVLVYLPYAYVMQDMKATAGHWVFNHHNYTDKTRQAVRFFLALKDSVEAAGMHVLPGFTDLSWENVWITGVPSSNWPRCNALSEFSSRTNLLNFAVQNHLWPYDPTDSIGCDTIYNKVTCADDSNTTASDIFMEQLKIFQKNWGHTTNNTLCGLYPQYICLGHDEIGGWENPPKFLCFVGADKTKDLVNKHGGGSVGQSWVIAHQIKTRYKQISDSCNPGVKMILWGDCFIPLCNGQSAGLVGDQNGNGGILQFLRDTMKLANNCIIEPWNYWNVNGTPTLGGLGYIFNQNTQVQFIQKLGFGYILASGEGGDYLNVNKNTILGGMANVRQHLQVAFEQVRASQVYPNNFYGFGDNLFETSFNNAGGFLDTLVGYTLPILAYFGWTSGDDSLKLSRYHSFTPQVYAKFNPIHSRKNLSWSLGKDYNTP